MAQAARRPSHWASRSAFLALLLGLPLGGCLGTAVNSAQVYAPVAGVVTVTVSVPAGESIQRVQFQLNDVVVAEDADGADGFAAEVDLSALPVETLAKVAAVGVRPNGTFLILRENYLLVTTPTDGTAPLPGTADPNATGTAAFRRPKTTIRL